MGKNSIPEVARRLIKPSIALIILISGFAVLYFLLCSVPGHGIGPDPSSKSLLDCLYFSVITISSLGYGDLHPLGFSRPIASIEVLAGLVFIGIFVSRIVSVKQDETLNYVMQSRILQTYDECLSVIREAKEQIADERRRVGRTKVAELGSFDLNLNHPLYPAKRALEIVTAYARHVISIKQIENLDGRLDRTTAHVEELAGVTCRYLRVLDWAGISWRTKRSRTTLRGIISLFDAYRAEVIKYSKYHSEGYKNMSNIYDVMENHMKELNSLLEKKKA